MTLALVLAQPPGYSETFFNSKIKGLQEHGMDVRLYCQSKKNGFTLCPVILSPRVSRNPLLQLWCFIKEFTLLLPHLPVVLRYIKLERKEGTGMVQLLKKIYLNAHLLKANLDWLHFGFATMALGSETVAKAIGAKMAVSFRGFDINVYPIKHPECYNLLWKYVDKVHSISHYLLEKARSKGLPRATPYAIITPAVQLATLPTHLAPKASSGPVKIVTIARLHWIKGYDYALRACKLLQEKGILFHYTIVGGAGEEELQFLIADLGLDDCVFLEDKISQQAVFKKMNKASLLLMPSLEEGIPNVVVEAMALGLPVISTNCGGIPELIPNGIEGWIVPMRNPEAMADAIESFSRLSLNKIEEVRLAARKKVEQQHSEALMIEGMEELYLEVLR